MGENSPMTRNERYAAHADHCATIIEKIANCTNPEYKEMWQQRLDALERQFANELRRLDDDIDNQSIK